MITVAAVAAITAVAASAVVVAVLLAHRFAAAQLAGQLAGHRARYCELETQRQDLAEALATSEESFRAAFDNAPIGISMISVTDDHSDRFIRVNSAFARLLGHPAQGLEGRLVSDFTHPQDRHLMKQRTAAVDGPASIEKRYLHASGRPVWVEVSYSMVPGRDGAEPYFIAQIEDISTRKESERALLDALRRQEDAARHLRELDALRTDMVATISHELRTPLASIKGYVEILADGDVGELSEPQAAMVRTVADSTERLTDLVDDLLALARLDAAEALEPAMDDDPPVDLCELVAGAVHAVGPVTSAKRQQVLLDVPAGGVPVRGDFRLLERAVLNLLANSSKYSGEGGRIGVAVRCDGPYAELVVSDDGIGIAVEEQGRLFDRFFRSTRAQEYAASGSGLGLAIVRSVVERHGGQVRVDSRPGEGSAFTVTLPAVSGDVPAQPRSRCATVPTVPTAQHPTAQHPTAQHRAAQHPAKEIPSWRAS